ncbi:MAG: hypothetical protein U0521_15800 [Anaerolineae bacterium]
MASDNVENEVKLYVPDLAAVARRVKAAGGRLKALRVYVSATSATTTTPAC